MGKYFGTDGFRGEAGVDLTAYHAFRIGLFLGWYYAKHPKFERPEGYHSRIVVGKDTRRSSYMLEDALAAGLAAAGTDAYLLHVTTTPSVSYVTRTEDFDCGVMITASHNPFTDNGIKLVNERGEKMTSDVIADIEAYLDGTFAPEGWTGALPWDVPLATGADIGCVVDHAAGRNRYIAYLISLATCSYKDKKVGLDCSNGSTWQIAKSVFDALGAQTFVMSNRPNGVNINLNCGSTHIEGLQRFVREKGLDVGFAFDGDADRCLAVDEHGEVVNGDEILYIYTKHLLGKGRMGDSKVVTTIMSNRGLYEALDALGVGYETTLVGDKYVYENMMETGNLLGGEQSGHIIFKNYATTGDGLITAIKVMECMLEQKQTLSALRAGITLWPQIFINATVRERDAVLSDPSVLKAKEQAEALTGPQGRVVLRASGTESIVRIMTEAREASAAQGAADLLTEAIRKTGRLLEID